MNLIPITSNKEFNDVNSELKDQSNLPTVYAEGYLEDLEMRPNFSVEANFMFLPIFSFDRHSSNQRSKITHSVPILKNGAVTTSTLSISTAEILDGSKSVNPGLPSAFDMQVLFCLMDLWDEHGKPEDGIVHFRLTTICKRLNLSISGRTFSEIKFSIKKLAVTKLESASAFYSAERATYINTLASILESPEFVVHKAGGGKSNEMCQVTLSKYILKNLMNNYRGQINRKLYQSLDNGFAQRIFSIYQYRVQFQRERSYVDFELMDLAAILPMSGKLYPSKVRERLTKALSELFEKEVLKHDFIKVGSRTVLRLTSFHTKNVELTSEEHIPEFIRYVEAVYHTNPYEYFDISPAIFQKYVSKHSELIEFGGKNYNKCFHVFDVALYQILKTGYKVDSRGRWINYLLEKVGVDYPSTFKPVDILYAELMAKEEVKKAIEIKDASVKDAEDELFRVAMSYVSCLKPDILEQYKSRVKENNPLFNEYTSQFSIAELIVDDMKKGVNFTQFIDEMKLPLNKRNTLLGSDQTGNT